MNLVDAMEAMVNHTTEQWGLITAAQAKTVGVDGMTLQRAVEAGLLERVRRGCYLATAATMPKHLQPKAVWLALNPTVPAWERPDLDPDGGVISHSSAALIHGIGDLRADIVEITVPRRRVTREQDVSPRRAELTEDDVELVDGLPVTTVPRTITDHLADHIDGGHVGAMIYHAARRGLVDLDQLANRSGTYARRYGLPRGHGRSLIEYLLAQAGHSLADLVAPNGLVRTSDLRHILEVLPRTTLSLSGTPINAALAQMVESIQGMVPAAGVLENLSVPLTSFARSLPQLSSSHIEGLRRSLSQLDVLNRQAELLRALELPHASAEIARSSSIMAAALAAAGAEAARSAAMPGEDDEDMP
ncbi:type IV toxin-antitoxin system AbiEi family antitoxin domain-containing protein [Actinokineospora iranica]|nr:type IV toxin-antitoxin system AbiEi family antitoxin domain-containing protein [Actinokineospora iranica]